MTDTNGPGAGAASPVPARALETGTTAASPVPPRAPETGTTGTIGTTGTTAAFPASPRALDAGAPTAKRLPGEIWVLVGAAFLVAIGYGLVAPALPTFARSFGVGISAASAVISAFAFFRLFFAPASGRLVNAFGERRVFLVGLLVVAASSGASALAESYWQLLTFRAVGGIGSTMFSVSAISLLIRIAPPAQRGRASGLWSSGFLLGSIAGPLVGGGLVSVSIRAPFVVYAGVLVITAAVSEIFLRRSTLSAPLPATGDPTLTLAEALRLPAYRAALAGSFSTGWLVYGVRVALVPLFVVEVLGQQPSWAGFALTVFAVGNAATLMVSGRWADRRGRKPPIVLGLLLSALSIGGLGFITSLPLFLAVSLIGGIGGGLVNPPLNAVIADVVGAGRRGGPVLAGFQMVSDLGGILGPVVAGLVAERTSYGVAFAVTGVVALLALMAWIRAPETLPSAVAARRAAVPVDQRTPAGGVSGPQP
jgi:MFS family permease